jgi:hypothetical protein
MIIGNIHFELGDLATWFTGIITFFLFIIAFIQIRNERIARIKSEKEFETRKKRDQAEHISCWFVKETSTKHGVWVWVAILNQSSQPIYNVIVSMVALSQTGENLTTIKPHIACIDIVPPGQGYIGIEALQFGHPGLSRAGVEIAFKDIFENNWIRKTNGELVSLENSTIEYYKIDLPTSWQGIAYAIPEE